MAILKQKANTQTRPLSVRIDVDLFAQIDAIKAEASAAGFEFDAADVCSKALAAAVKAARAELAALHPQPSAAPMQPATQNVYTV
ncbi:MULTISPECIES: hypothetical protein [unclassified Thiomonas]|jgi:hypothetical protein|uniref:hypothetical protein n=1 Tax=unclassified Thiomonas TaxID=2625466 RepID=UPI000BD01105|nr:MULTISPECIES: hypothetical protein [unclassified Thiomonas]OZB72199.1 MAG: hypothetical protein B7X30_01015 [Thiomonas sp. 13-64-67]